MTYQALEYLKLQENQRHNLASENLGFQQLEETKRSNVARENETHRANVAHENLSWSTLGETIRHNQQTEKLSWGQLDETIRHNKVYEDQQRVSNAISLVNAQNQAHKIQNDLDIAKNELKFKQDALMFQNLTKLERNNLAAEYAGLTNNGWGSTAHGVAQFWEMLDDILTIGGKI